MREVRKLLAFGCAALVLASCSGGAGEGRKEAVRPSERTNGTPTAPVGEAFYEPPDPLPPAKPGDLIWSAPIAGVEGARAWRVLYRSTAADGRAVAVSGIVAAPVAPGGDRPVVALAHPTMGLADGCAPSKQDGLGIPDIVLRPLLDAGYVVAATDYEGLGTPGPHPYGVAASAARSVLDSVRAARRLPGSGASKRSVVFGHSQGGHAALAAAGAAPDYAPELEVLGAVGAAPMIDPGELTRISGGVPGALGFAVMLTRGVGAAYPALDASDVFTEAGATLSDLVEEQCANDLLASFRPRSHAEVFAQSPTDVTEWRARMAASALKPKQVEAPMLVVQGDADRVLPQRLADAFVAELCAAGDPIDYRVYPGADHPSVLAAASDDVTGWLKDRFAGTPFASTC